MKAGSFCSITSEGDGDIFEPTGQLKEENEENAEGLEDTKLLTVRRFLMPTSGGS